MLKNSFKFLSAISALIIAGCTQVGLGAANLPAKFSDTQIKKDIAYGSEPWQKLDIYIPKETENKKLPVLTFFYGGRWTDGSKDMYKFVGDAFAKKGYIVVIPDYSKYPKVKFPTFVEDAAAAIAWTYKNIDQYNGNTDNFFISGHSSGAHIGSLAFVDESYLKKHDLKSDIITAFAGLSGPYDFIPEAEDLKDMFGPPEKYSLMQVTTHVDGDEAPKLLLWGEEDEAVWARNHELLAKEIKKKNGQVEVKTYEELNHVEIIGSLTWFWRSKAPIFKDMLEFFDKHKMKEEIS